MICCSPCRSAAKDGHLKCLKYAHENGFSWDKNVWSSTARNGHLECLKYLLEKNVHGINKHVQMLLKMGIWNV